MAVVCVLIRFPLFSFSGPGGKRQIIMNVSNFSAPRPRATCDSPFVLSSFILLSFFNVFNLSCYFSSHPFFSSFINSFSCCCSLFLCILFFSFFHSHIFGKKEDSETYSYIKAVLWFVRASLIRLQSWLTSHRDATSTDLSRPPHR